MSASRAISLGAISGLRSLSGPAFLSRAASKGLVSLDGTALAFLGSLRLSKVLVIMELAEIIGDKLPITPSRTSPPILLGRAASGGLVGAVSSLSGDRPAATGAALGSSAAVAAAFAAERLRALVGQKTGIPDLVVALAEDAIVLFVGHRSLREGR